MRCALGPKERYIGVVPPVALAVLERRALARRLFDYMYPLGRVLMAMLFFALYRPEPTELHVVSTGAARVVGVSAAHVASAARLAVRQQPPRAPHFTCETSSPRALR